MKWIEERALAEDAARRAGQYLRDAATGELRVDSARGRDIKLQADLAAEELIIQRLQQGSGLPILCEESGEHGLQAGGAFWVVDPLDGTFNYSRGVPLCAVSIALVREETPLMGVVYHFGQDEMYQGIVGQGASLRTPDGEATLQVSGVEDVGQASLVTGLPVNSDFSDGALRDFVHQAQRFKKVRLLGSAALSLALIAAGRFDAYSEDGIMLWDVAAGLALVRAAGGYTLLKPSSRAKWAFDVRAASSAAIWEDYR